MAKDDQTESAVRQRLSDARLEGSDMHVSVKASTARLTGTVKQAAHRYAAVAIAHATPGVMRVENDITVEAPSTTSN